LLAYNYDRFPEGIYMSSNHRSAIAHEPSAQVDWQSWLQRWDVQQTGYLPDREARFNAMLDVLEALLPETFVALDLACGPGAISQRLLARFPQARCVAVDFDPVLLTMGQSVLGTVGGRLRWVSADLMTAEWSAEIGEAQFDAVLSTTALHWLAPEHLIRLYGQLGQLVRPGGVVLNGDHMKFRPSMETFQRVADTVKAHRQEDAFTRRGVEDWTTWWQALEAEPALRDLFAERERRFAWKAQGWHAPIYDVHEAALRDAGFREVGVIWQTMDNRVLMAMR
jgi:trans-aconitate methyltransferase